MNAFDVLRQPLITEKSQDKKGFERTVCFRVHPDATKSDVKSAVEKIFKVKVADVRTANYLGKMRRRGKSFGSRPDWKKAYVKIKEGEKMVEYAEV
jgi:large subunit ribosomal protein L23